MKTIIPDYYTRFHCIASDCRHSCCMEGWEIEIDDASLKYYRRIMENDTGELTDKLKENLFIPTVKERRQGLKPSIRQKNGVCPFLTENRLCELILSKSDRSLCQICRDHPRFRNVYHDHEELGIGMACEEALRLILTQNKKTEYLDLKTKEPAVPFHRKAEQQCTSQRTLNTEIESIQDFEKILTVLSQMDILTEAFQETVCETKNLTYEDFKDEVFSCDIFQKALPAITEYFRFRYEGKEGRCFVENCIRLLRLMVCSEIKRKHSLTWEAFTEFLRCFSSEIEYCSENIEIIREISKVR